MSRKELFLWGFFAIGFFFAGFIKGYFIPIEIQRNNLHQFEDEAIILTSHPEFLPKPIIYHIEEQIKTTLKIEKVSSFQELKSKLTSKNYHLLFVEHHWLDFLKEHLLILQTDKIPHQISGDFIRNDKLGLPLLWALEGFLIDKKQKKDFSAWLNQKNIYLTNQTDILYFFGKTYLKNLESVRSFPLQTSKKPPQPLPGVWQYSHGLSAQALSSRDDLEYFIPDQGVGLWMFSMAIPQKTPSINNSYSIAEKFFNSKVAIGMSYLTGMASTWKVNSSLLSSQRADYIRSINLNKIIPIEKAPENF